MISKIWVIHKLDVKIAFLNGDLFEQVYVKQPSGYFHPMFPQHHFYLRKALYGLKQDL